jgi:hypothetical protein
MLKPFVRGHWNVVDVAVMSVSVPSVDDRSIEFLVERMNVCELLCRQVRNRRGLREY